MHPDVAAVAEACATARNDSMEEEFKIILEEGPAATAAAELADHSS